MLGCIVDLRLEKGSMRGSTVGAPVLLCLSSDWVLASKLLNAEVDVE